MRLTTRLMQLASWLLVQRAVNEGEMTQDQAGQEKAKVKSRPPLGGPEDDAPRPAGAPAGPDRALDSLQASVLTLDAMINEATPERRPDRQPAGAGVTQPARRAADSNSVRPKTTDSGKRKPRQKRGVFPFGPTGSAPHF